MREIILDTETTGLDPFDGHRVIEIGCVEMINRVKTGSYYHCYINPERDVPREAFLVHGISYEFLKDKKVFKDIAEEFIEYIADSTLVIHNAKFDLKFLNYELSNIGIADLSEARVVDTLNVARKTFPGSPASLDSLCKRYKIDLSKREKHGALLDAELLADVYINLMGGKQSKLEFIEEKRNRLVNAMKVPKQFKEPRNFSVSQEEANAHQEIIKMMKNPVWSEE